MADVILRGGTVVDGSGGPPIVADVSVTAGLIEAVGGLGGATAELELEVRGLTVAPGFIDAHSHSELALMEDPWAAPKVAQGVTTEVVANCGFGPFPAGGRAAREMMSALVLPSDDTVPPPSFGSVADYGAALAREGIAVNVASLLPHGIIRAGVMGVEDRTAGDAELEAMCRAVHEGMEQGAVGLSLGLLYAPGCFASTAELAELAGAVAAHGGVLASHGRNECDRFEESVAEVIEVGRQAGCAVHISHLKVADPANWGRVGAVLGLIERANAGGLRVTCDQYPYTAGSSVLQTLLPPWSLAGGAQALLSRLRDPQARERISRALAGVDEIPGWDNLSRRIGWDRIVIGSARGAEKWEGRSLSEVAGATGGTPPEALFEVILTSRASAVGIFHQMCEEDVRAVMVHPAQMVGSDGLPARGKPHPRLWGTFPRVLGRYARELGLLSLAEAIHKMTGRTAQTFGLPGRGLIRPGCHADLCVFEAETIADRATYEAPTQPPVGIVHVFCNGVPTMLDGKRTEHRPGVFVTRNADRDGGQGRSAA